MSKKVIRMIIPENLYIKFKVICAQRDTSLPKMNAELIRHFVEVDETNKKIMNMRK